MVFSCFVVLSLFKEITMLTRSTGIIIRGHEGGWGGGGRKGVARVECVRAGGTGEGGNLFNIDSSS